MDSIIQNKKRVFSLRLQDSNRFLELLRVTPRFLWYKQPKEKRKARLKGLALWGLMPQERKERCTQKPGNGFIY